jgi:signal transduction histidine kinase
MIRLVAPSDAQPGREDTSLASMGRWALAADAVLLIDLSRTRGRTLVASAGLGEDESRAACAAIDGARLPGPGGLAVPGFSAASYCEQRVPDVGAAAICALKRHPSGFENVESASIFAAHTAVACAARRHLRRRNRVEPIGPPPASGAWVLDDVGYEELNRAIVHEVGLATGATTAGVLIWDDDRNLLCPVPGAFGSDPETLPPAHAAHDWGSSAARVFATGQPYLTNCAADDPGVLQDVIEAFDFKRLMTLPISVGARRVGVLQIANKASDFTLDDLDAAVALGDRIAVGVEVARMRDRLRRGRRMEEVLSRMAVEIAGGRHLDDYLAAAMDGLCEIVRGSLVALVPFDGDPVLSRRRRGGAEHLERTLLTQARAATSLRIYGVGPRRAGEPGWSVAHVPVLLEGTQVATLSVMRRGGDFFDVEESHGFSRLAHLIALGWSTEHYQRQLADSARIGERQRIADALHDQVAQLLFAARLSLDFASELDDVPAAAADGIRRGRDLLLRADAATRQIMEQNSPPVEESLPDRLAAMIGGLEDEFGRPVALDVSDEAALASRRMSRSALTLLTRASREALVNAIKHAGPCQLSVRASVTRRRRILVTVTDGGIGVNARRGDGYGTAALRRSVRLHGGVLRVAETSTGGTKVAVSLPL